MFKISIVIPVYNEEKNIKQVITELLAYLGEGDGEIIIVNDGSNDATEKIIEEMSSNYPKIIRCIHHPINMGYARALRDGFQAAQGEWTFYMDGDGQYDPENLDALLSFENDGDFIVGYRKNRQDSSLRIFLGKGFNVIVRLLFDIPVQDADCAFKLMRTEKLNQIQIDSSGFLVDVEILAKAKKLGFIILETGVSHKPRRHGSSSIRFSHIIKMLLGFFWLKRELKKTK